MTTVISVSVTERGRALAARLPFPAVHGDARATVADRWAEADGFVLFLATGAAVRIIAPLLHAKATDPAVVCVDEAGRFAVALCGGHARGANRLARQVADLIGAEPVITTATDAAGVTAVDQVPGLVATGDVAGVSAAMVDGHFPTVVNELGWPLPSGLTAPVAAATGPTMLVITDRALPPAAGEVALHPPSLVVGVGASTGAPVDEVAALVGAALTEAGLARASVAEVATIDRRANDPAIGALGLPVRAFTADALAAVAVPTPSTVVAAAVGTSSVAEAAALLAAGTDAELVVHKRVSPHATVAIARRRRPRGSLAIVGLGPGQPRHRTPAADVAVGHAQVVIGYGPYVDQCADLLGPHHDVVRSPIGDEVVRAKQALAEAGAGRRVALVSSGDPGVYAMAGIALELAADVAPDVDIEVVPGVPAAQAVAALLGAPLAHDHVVISLSDLLTPWSAIETRLKAAADADLVVVLYNPRSRGRSWQLDAALTLLGARRAPGTPVGVVTDAARPTQRVVLTTLADLDVESVGMTTCVIVGSSTTRVAAGRMVTPRGYQPC
ncbi:MAG: cobalt-precorrin hydrolase / cobalt-factor methyltransferase / precorrin-3B [Acidimicrobiaceae bacterium]|jgi:cobalt-precorrin 5A hydrolase/precorrin-3B C17-methyltransferase